VSENSENRRQDRDQLVVQRNLLFKKLLKNPAEISLSVKIRTIDDEVAEHNARIQNQNKSEQRRGKKTKAFDLAEVSLRTDRLGRSG
jgi:hypothetical protein